MSSVLTQNYFDIFSLPRRYGLDRGGLDARYRDLQRSVHPDRFASGSDHERRVLQTIRTVDVGACTA